MHRNYCFPHVPQWFMCKLNSFRPPCCMASCAGQQPGLMSVQPALCASYNSTILTFQIEIDVKSQCIFFLLSVTLPPYFHWLNFDPCSWLRPWGTLQITPIPVRSSSPSPSCRNSVWCCAAIAKTRTSAPTFQEYTGLYYNIQHFHAVL